jgi:membrane-bound metal-dependent hydrolase YbcI (DUF457 family)
VKLFRYKSIGTILIYLALQWLFINILNPKFMNPQIILASTMIGFLSHLAGDMFTKEGIPLLFPFKLAFGFPPVKFLRIKTGKFIEKYLIYPGVWVYTLIFIYSSQNEILSIPNLLK